MDREQGQRASSPEHDRDSSDDETIRADPEEDQIVGILEAERQEDASNARAERGPVSNRYRQLLRQRDDASEAGSSEGAPRRAGSPIDSLLSVPDDTPSVQGSLLSSPGSSILPSVASRPGLSSPTPSFRPFDRRFQSRISTPSILSPRPSSPAFLTAHSRNVSMGSQFLLDSGEPETPSSPWEIVRWTKLNKLIGQAFSESGRRNFGSPTCVAVSASIVLGTSKGIILMFDYSQNLKMIIGPGTRAVESGAVTAVAISADHTTVGGGHANGNIFTWDTGRASRPFLQIPHLDHAQVQNRTIDGHMPNVAITHLGFLGTRRTALVSADDRGMAFSHLATRGTGALGRTVKTVRILGRYPDAPAPSGKPLKPSTVLAFSPLPLGNVERATDSMGLTAMLTPYLLVIVSTTPIAQTQHKSARPKDVAPHSAMSGCLAWFPAVKLKIPDPATGSTTSKAKLVYCWSNVLTVLDVDEVHSDDKDKPPALKFRARSRWKCEEAIVAVQWLTRSVLTVLTITQRLIVLEDRTMRMTEALDLIHKHIYHSDLFSTQLHNLVEQLDEQDPSMHGVVADAFYMSLKTYKSKVFLLGFNEISIGSLSNWADRLIALMGNGDYVGAIQLATSFYAGDTNKLTVGLPEDNASRHQMVRDKLLEIMSASLKYAFGQRRKHDASADDQHLQELAETCFVACQTVQDNDFLFEEMYEWYEEAEAEGIFLEVLEPYILERTISIVPPTAVKAMVTHFVSRGWESRLEEMICHMETATLDIDQITVLCKQHGLYDALIYVWNQALHDYITPLIDLLTLLKPLLQNSDYLSAGPLMDNEDFGVNAVKMFPYLSYTLTGRIYPTGEMMRDDLTSQAKAEIYWFLFSGKSITWPKGSNKPFLTQPAEVQEPSFPYLRMILNFDAPSFLSALNEAFEDAFLNESQEKPLNGGTGKDLPEELMFGLTVDRQYVVSILLEVMNPEEFAPADMIYLDMFIARNLSKFPQYLIIPGSSLDQIVAGLCEYPGDDLAEDAQLSAEYLLSVYHPPDLTPMIPLFKKAGFYRILKRIYKNDKEFGKLIQSYFEHLEDQEEVFDALTECLRPQAGLTKKQVQDVLDVIKEHSRDLVELDPVRAAQTLNTYATDLHRFVLDSLEDGSELQYIYLKALLEPESESVDQIASTLDRDLIERYVKLMCQYHSSHVSDFVSTIQATNLRLEELLPALEDTGVVDAAVILMAREGQVQDAMERLTRHLTTLESAVHGLLSDTHGQDDRIDVESAAEDLLTGLQKYTHVGIWLCQGQMKTSSKLNALQGRQSSPALSELLPDEKLWLELIDTNVQITRRLSSLVASHSPHSASSAESVDPEKLVALLRSLVQHVFTALLTATSTQEGGGQSSNNARLITSSSSGGNLTFLRILRAFLTRAVAASPSLADLRAVLASIFAAYAYEESILQLAGRLLEQQLFASVSRAVELRQRGWRPRGSTCEACGRRLWGPGAFAGAGGGNNVFEAWEERQRAERERRAERKTMKDVDVRGKDRAAESARARPDGDYYHGYSGNGNGKGKGKSAEADSHPHPNQSGAAPGGAGDAARQADDVNGDVGPRRTTDHQQQQQQPPPLGPLVVLACRHIYHQRCLDALQGPAAEDGGGGQRTVDEYGRERAYRCPIDG
ncbi:Golgi CORVET complex core vacuolar protein 8-domain-containing protein [Xylariaceae sp. FL0804]|nr:Golgi CORVET complex core vacuolar protein 8-domain-containing protein [Xylariaceae sp. FL0804]